MLAAGAAGIAWVPALLAWFASWSATVTAAARAAVFLVKVLPMVPSRPVDYLTKRPVVDRVTYPSRLGPVEGDLYRPASSRPVPGIVVCLGVVPFGVDHPQVARLGEALARSGFAALLYWSPAMRDRRLDPDDVESLALAYEWLAGQPYVDGSRSGLLGTCVGGAFALMAAAHPRIRDDVAFIAAFAPYSSMSTFVFDVASAPRVRGETREPWQVDPLTREVFERTIEAALEQGDGQPVEGPRAGPAPASDSIAARRLLAAADPIEAAAALEALPAALQRRLAALSPLVTVLEIRARLIVVGHDRDDQVVPVSESHQLVAALDGRPGVHYTEFAFFQHATPRRLSLLPLARELGRFYRYVYPLFRVTAP